LAYYTDFVFEVWDRQGAFRAILGGGRYSNLMSDVGGEPMGGIGFAMGDVVIGLVLEQYGLKPSLKPCPTRVLVTIFSAEQIGVSVRAAARLRAAGINTELYPDAVKLDRQLKYANANSIPLAVIIGPDEAAAGKATVKNLATGQQQVVSLSELVGVVAAQ
jgi:histidyl-tRNA synthetase